MADKHQKKKGQPKGKIPARPSRVPKGSQPESFRYKRPLFCFEHVDISSKELWVYEPDTEDSAEILNFLRLMSELTWVQIEDVTVTGRKSGPKHHLQPIDSIDRKAQNDLIRRELDQKFADSPIFRFRLSGEKRLWGFRRGRIFHAVWWDDKHQVCPGKRK